MARNKKKDLLSEAIADAKAVRETALANAKLALEEAFTPKLQSMLSAKLQQEMDDEDMEGEEDLEDVSMDDEMGADDELGMEAEMGMEDDGMEADEYADMGEDEMDMEDEVGASDEYADDEELGEGGDYADMGDDEYEDEELGENSTDEDEYQDDGYAGMGEDEDDDLNLEAIIKELEDEMGEDEVEDLGEQDEVEVEDEDEVEDLGEEDGHSEPDPDADIHIDEIIAALREDDSFTGDGTPDGDADKESSEEEAMKEELDEAYDTIRIMQGTLKEVNLLNAKLLFTNKLFRAYELSEAQKVKVIDNFDRAGSTREVKLVFATLAESFKMPAKRRRLKEGVASKAVRSTKPSKSTILTEGQELASRFQKLANLNPKKRKS